MRLSKMRICMSPLNLSLKNHNFPISRNQHSPNPPSLTATLNTTPQVLDFVTQLDLLPLSAKNMLARIYNIYARSVVIGISKICFCVWNVQRVINMANLVVYGTRVRKFTHLIRKRKIVFFVESISFWIMLCPCYWWENKE